MKISHILTTLLAGVSLCAAHPSPTEADYEQALAVPRDEALKEVSENVMALCRQMEAVQNREAADALAKEIERVFFRVIALMDQHDLEEEEMHAYLREKGFTHERLDLAVKRLIDEKCYGSTALTDIFGPQLTDEVELSPASEEITTELGELVAGIIKEKGYNWGGGPGTTRETAWILPSTDQAVSMQYDILDELEPEVTADSQALVEEENGKKYDVHTLIIRTADDIYTAEMWFDITAYWNMMSDEDNGE